MLPAELSTSWFPMWPQRIGALVDGMTSVGGEAAGAYRMRGSHNLATAPLDASSSVAGIMLEEALAAPIRDRSKVSCII
jgi:hypothetical protein